LSELESVGQFIATVGFPAAIAIYVLVRMEPRIASLEKTIKVLTVVVAKTQGIDMEEAERLAGKCRE